VEAKFLGMKQHLSELRDSVSDLSSNFAALLKSKDKDSGTVSKGSGEPPLKKQRLDGADATADTTEITLQSAALQEVQERLASVSRQISDLQNDIYQRDALVEDEIAAEVVAQMLAVRDDAAELAAVEEGRVWKLSRG